MGTLTRKDFRLTADVMIRLFTPNKVSDKYIDEFIEKFEHYKTFDKKKFIKYIRDKEKLALHERRMAGPGNIPQTKKPSDSHTTAGFSKPEKSHHSKGILGRNSGRYKSIVELEEMIKDSQSEIKKYRKELRRRRALK